MIPSKCYYFYSLLHHSLSTFPLHITPVVYNKLNNPPKSTNTMSTETNHKHTEEQEQEQDKLRLMRALVEKLDPTTKEEDGVDESTMRRFLRARDMDVERGAKMLVKYMKWRRGLGGFRESEFENEIKQNKIFAQGFDKKGRPVGVLFGARHFQNKNPDQFKRFAVYCLEKLCQKTPPGQEKFVVIGDLQGWGYANSDIRGYLGALSILQDYYPERLGKVFIIHAPYVFMTIWKIVYPFIDDNTKKKIMFVEDQKIKSTLLEEIDESQIPDIYGGQLPLIPIHEA